MPGEGIARPAKPKTGREKVLPTLTAMLDLLEAMDARLTEALAALATPRVEIREWHPDHRRVVDGGTHVNAQRKRVRRETRS